MKIRLLIIISILISNVNLFGQTKKSDDIFYSRYEGIVDSNFNVTANVVRLKDNISGNYNYHFTSIEESNSYSKSIYLTGETNKNEYQFKEFGKNDTVLAGSIDKEKIEGYWYYEPNYDIPFNIIESYPSGSMPFDVHYLHSEDRLIVDMDESPVAEIELTLIYPMANVDNNVVVDLVCQNIAEGFFGSNFYEYNPDSMLTKFENEYYKNYLDQNVDRYDSGASFNWQKIVSMSVINNSNYVVCLEFLKYAYSGGAHGMTNISYYNIDLNSGKPMEYANIFIDDTTGLLSTILTQQLYDDKQIPEDISLTKAGYFVESLEPNHNIYINNTGIGFMYNSYEIAPYSFGQTSIFLSYDKVKHLLKKDSPVYNLMK